MGKSGDSCLVSGCRVEGLIKLDPVPEAGERFRCVSLNGACEIEQNVAW